MHYGTRMAPFETCFILQLSTAAHVSGRDASFDDFVLFFQTHFNCSNLFIVMIPPQIRSCVYVCVIVVARA